MSADDLESQLRQGGEVVATGNFRIDAQRALTKLREFRLAEPHHWVLEVLRAAHRSGATSVKVDLDLDDVAIEFDGRPFAPALMKDLLAQSLASGGSDEDQRGRLLSLGVAGALALKPKWIRVESGGVQLEVVPPDEVVVGTSASKTTRVALRKPRGWTLLTGLLSKNPEREAIVDRARWFQSPLRVNGARVDRLFTIDDDALGAAKYEGADMELKAAHPRADLDHHRLTLVSQGVIVSHREFEAPGLPCLVLARCDALRRNASGSDVVDNDPVTEKVFARARAVVAEVTQELAQGLTTRNDPLLRGRLITLALDAPAPSLRAVLDQAPLLPGPAGEWYSTADFKKELSEGRPLRYALKACPKGSYPTPAVLLSVGGSLYRQLLPGEPKVDVKDIVDRRARAAQARERWLAQLVEPTAMPPGGDVARGRIQTGGLTGEVSLVRSGSGAFVRLLAQGRPLQMGEVDTLAPLRLRATVNWNKEPPASMWAELPSRKLWSVAAQAIEAAFQTALFEALAARPDDPQVLAHATDLLERIAQLGRGLKGVPAALAEARVFECLDGSKVGLATLLDEPVWRFTVFRGDHGLLSNARVLVLFDQRKAILESLAKDRLHPVTARLDKERGIRDRLAGPKWKAVLEDAAARVRIDGSGLTGEVGVPHRRDSQLTLRMLRAGIPIELTTLNARYGLAWAVIDCADFQPDADWEKVTRDGVFSRALAAVREAEGRLPLAILEAWPRATLEELPPGCLAFLLAFLLKEADGAGGTPTPVLKRVLEAKLFATTDGKASLTEVRARVAKEGALYLRPPEHGVQGEGVFIVRAGQEVGEVLGKLLGKTPESPDAVLARNSSLRDYLARPAVAPALPSTVLASVAIDSEGVKGLIGLVPGTTGGAEAQFLVQQRRWHAESLPSFLPLVASLELAGVDPLLAAAPADALRRVTAAIWQTELELVRRALVAPETELSQRVLLLAVGAEVDQKVKDLQVRLLDTPFFPCTDGVLRSVRALSQRKTVQTVKVALEGAPALGNPVVVAVDPFVCAGLARWHSREDVTEQLGRELTLNAKRARLLPRSHITAASPSPFRQSFQQGELEGEVVLAEAQAGSLELFQGRKPLCTLEAELPEPLAAAVNFDRLVPATDQVGVARDAALKQVLEVVLGEADGLARAVASAWPDATPQRQRELVPALVRLSVWSAARKPPASALLALPLLETTTGAPLSVARLLERRRAGQAIKVSSRRFAPLEADHWVWCPRPGELEALKPLGLKLSDATADLEHAESVRTRPKLAALAVPGAFAWREPFTGKTSQGEVVLRDTPTALLTIDVLRDRSRLEAWSSKHPVGAVAQVNCDGLTPTSSWKRAVHNRAFKAMVEEVEDALERLLVRRLEQGPRDDAHRGYAIATLGWHRPPEGPLAKLLPKLELFTDLEGVPVRLGTVLDEHARTRSVALARPGLPSRGGMVLADSPTTRAVLRQLNLEFEDVGPLLERAQKLDASRRARRLEQLAVKGEMLVRLAVQHEGITGELGLPRSAKEVPRVMLAKEGVAIAPAKVEGGLPVAGVLDWKELEVNDEWTQARPNRKLTDLLAERVDALYAQLAPLVGTLPADDRARARDLALEFLSHRGLSYAQGLDSLTGGAKSLAQAPLFRTTAGQWLSLASLADHVVRGEPVGVLEKRLLKPDVGDALVIETSNTEAPWVEALRRVLGPSSVVRIIDLAAWKRTRAEADPQAGTPRHRGLLQLRRQMKLLRAGALGQLTPRELEDVKLSTGKARRPVQYDGQRRLVLLDGNDPLLCRALEELGARPERLYVLLAAVYGEVNRALDRVTDDHEAHLLGALAVHLASNPEILQAAPAVDGSGDDSR